MKYNFEVTLGLLTFRSPITLENTLKSYKHNDFLEMFDDVICIIQPSNVQDLEIEVCNKFAIKYEVQKDNLRMAGAIKRIWEVAKYDKMMFLECDFVLCESKKKILSILDLSLNMLENKSIDMIRLRSLKNPGHPIQHNLFKEHHKNEHWKNDADILRQSNYITNYSSSPELEYPELITKVNNEPLFYVMSSRHCVYTNNPHITTRDFYNNEIKNYIDNTLILEDIIDKHWHFNDYRILITDGILRHNRLDGHIDCDCCLIEFGGRGRCLYKCCESGFITGVKYFEPNDIKKY